MRTVRKILKWSILLIISVIITFTIWFLLVAIDHPPMVIDMSCLNEERKQTGENSYVLGNNWLRKSESGLWEMYIEGEPFERGVAFGKLTKELLLYQETAFVEQIRELIPSERYLGFLKYFLAWFNRNLDRNITEEYKLEIYGTSFSCSPEFDFIGSGYQRQLNYHAAHDIGHALQGLNMVGCTSFACWNEKSQDSTLLIARNFDFYAGSKFAENKIVCFYNPSEGHKFMMISWADMTGVVSGMNEKGLTVTINASKSSVPGQAYTPVSLVAREILQYASDIDEAYQIALKRKMFVSESFLIGSVKDGKSAIIEKTPRKLDIVYSSENHIVCSNHFQGKVFEDDETNISNINGSDSKYRFDRMEELLQNENSMDVQDAISVLRNRYGKENKNVGMGNPLVINQLIAHHAVIFKPEQQLVWVSTAPYQLGKFVSYDLNKIFSMDSTENADNNEIYSSDLTIPADPFLFSKEYNIYNEYLGMSARLKGFSKSQTQLPVTFEEDYISSNPEFYSVYAALADYFTELNEFDKAHRYYQIALSKEVPGEDLKKKLMNKSSEALTKSGHAGKGN